MEAVASAKYFTEKVSAVGANQELTALLAKVTDAELQLAAGNLQYGESSILYAVGHLQDPSSTKDPQSMRNVLDKQIAVATGNQLGYTQEAIQPQLWAAAVKLSEKP